MHRIALALMIGLTALTATAATPLEDAQAAMAEQQYARAAELFERLLGDSPDDASLHYQLGIALMESGQLDSASGHFDRAAELGYQALAVGYRLARLAARQGEAEAALSRLESIAEQGFAIPNLISDEPDFASLAGSPRFQGALARIQSARFPCKSSEAHRAFDFWIGSWDVSSQGQQAGNNDIIPILGDCVLFENWTSASGSTGKSFNYYDASRDHWRQIWIDDRGGVIEFTGQFEDGVLTYRAETVDSSGNAVLNRLVFTPNPDGSVRQHWTQSSDDGATWQDAFNGLYVRRTDEE